MMSLELGFGSIIERYQHARDAVVERHQRGRPETSTFLDSVTLTDEEMLARTAQQPDENAHSVATPASMPPPTRLAESGTGDIVGQVHAVAPRILVSRCIM